MAEGIIVIPAYNEEKNIAETLRGIKKIGLDLDILVVNDGSKDRTREVVKETGNNVISLPFNLGYGAALQTGFKYAKHKGYKYLIQFDGDGQHNPEDILSLVNEMKKDNVDIVIGSRFLGHGTLKTGIFKSVVIHMLRWLIKINTNSKITDPTSGLKCISRRTYEYYSLMENFPGDYPDADVLIHMLRNNYIIREVPANMKERVSGVSMHSGLKPVIYVLKILLSIFIVILRDLIQKKGV